MAVWSNHFSKQEPALPFQCTRDKYFFTIYSSGYRAQDLDEIWAGREPMRNEGTSLIMATNRRRKFYCLKDLSTFLTLPIEITYEIFSHLDPLDLYHLTFIPLFRNLLSSAKMHWLWNHSFKINKDVPILSLSDLDIPSWAELVFGRFICDGCHSSRAIPDCISRRRLCEPCARIKDAEMLGYVAEPISLQWNPRVDLSNFCTTLLNTCTEHLKVNGPEYEPLTFPFEISAVSTFGTSRTQLVYSFPNEEKLCDFLGAVMRYGDESCIAALGSRYNLTPTALSLFTCQINFEGWFSSARLRQDKEDRRLAFRLRKWIERKIRPVEYDSQDWEEVLIPAQGFLKTLSIDPRHPIRSLRKRWNQNRSEIISRLDLAASDRKKANEEERIESRRQMLQKYRQFFPFSMLRPDEDLPSLEELLLYGPISDMLKTALEKSDDKFEESDRFDFFTCCYQYMDMKKRNSMEEFTQHCPRIAFPRCVEHSAKMELTSAAMVYICEGCQRIDERHEDWHSNAPGVIAMPSKREMFIGWDEMVEHLQDDWLSIHPVRVHELATQASISAICLYGHNPEVVTLEAMAQIQDEETDIRLACLRCPHVLRSQMAMKWTDCIDHIMLFQEDPAHQEPQWEKVKHNQVEKRDITKVFA